VGGMRKVGGMRRLRCKAPIEDDERVMNLPDVSKKAVPEGSRKQDPWFWRFDRRKGMSNQGGSRMESK
jgi:hypothetical protein